MLDTSSEPAILFVVSMHFAIKAAIPDLPALRNTFFFAPWLRAKPLGIVRFDRFRFLLFCFFFALDDFRAFSGKLGCFSVCLAPRSACAVPRHPTNIRRMLESRVKQVAARKPLLAAAWFRFERRCGKPGCHCASGEKHRGHQLTYKDRGKTRTVYVPVDFTDEVRSWIDEHRRLKGLLQEISQLSLALVRSHAQEQKRRKGRL